MTVEQRLEQLERQNKRQRASLALLAVALCAVVVMGAGGKDGTFDTVRAKNIMVEQINAGLVYSMMGFIVHNEEGKVLATLSNSDDGSGGLLITYSPQEDKLASVGAHLKGRGIVATYSQRGSINTISALLGSKGEGGFLTTFSPQETKLVELGWTMSYGGAVKTYSPQGGKLVEIGSTLGDQGTVATYSERGSDLIELGAGIDGAAVKLRNNAGKSIILLGADPDQNGLVATYDQTVGWQKLVP